MSIRAITDENGVRVLEKIPEAAYHEAREQGCLTKAVLYLSEIRDDWATWLAPQLTQPHGLSYEAVSLLLCMAYIRTPLPAENLQKLTVELMGPTDLPKGDSWAERLLGILSETRMFTAKGDSVPLIKFPPMGGVQLESLVYWDLPELEISECFS